jgi:hypothetical protein
MTETEILERAIEKAHDNGWESPINNTDSFSAADLAAGIINGLELFGVIFDHGFAKALWGTVWVDRIRNDGIADWQYHLQRMVIANDPIEYLGEHV